MKTAKNRSRGTDMHDDSTGCTAEQGTYLGRYAGRSKEEEEEDGKNCSRRFLRSVRFVGVIP